MREVNAIALGHGTDQPVRAVSEIMTDRSVLFEGVMRVIRLRFRGAKVAEQLATIMNCEPRTAARYLAGERVPGGNETFALLLDHKVGPRAMGVLMAEAERRLSPTDFKDFQLEMVKAATRADVRDNNEVR